MKRALAFLFVLVVLVGILAPAASAVPRGPREVAGSSPSVEEFLVSIGGPTPQTKALACEFHDGPPRPCVQWVSCCSAACAACGGIKTVHCINPYSCECNAPGCV